MKTILRNMLAILLPAILAVGCSGSKEFRLDAASDDIGTQNVTLIYYTDGAYRVESVPAIDGQFSLTANVSAPTFVEVYTSGGSLLGEFIVEGGDHIEARFSAINPENILIKGNKNAEQLADFLKDNRPLVEGNDIDGLNRAIEEFVRKDPERFVATVLLTRYFTVEGYENTALELTRLIPDKYRRDRFTEGFEQLLNASLSSDTLSLGEVRGFSTGDSAMVFTPAGARVNLIMITDNDTRAADSIKTMLSALRAGSPREETLRIVDFGCDRDTMQWKATLRSLPDDYPAGITRLWLNAGMATEGISQTAPTTIPYFILTDSTGRLLYRSPSVSATRAAYGRLRKTLPAS